MLKRDPEVKMTLHGNWRMMHQVGHAEVDVYTTLEQGESHTGTQWQTSRELQMPSANRKRINGGWREPDIAVQWKQLLLCAHDSVLLYDCMTTTTGRSLQDVVIHFMVWHLRKMFVNKYVTVWPKRRKTGGIVQQTERCLLKSTIPGRIASINHTTGHL